MIAEPAANLMPELEVGTVSGKKTDLEWDLENEYYVSNLALFVELNSVPKITTLNEWLKNCNDLNVFYNENNFDNILKTYHKLENEKKILNNNNEKKSYVELHLGCKIKKILSLKNLVLSNGILRIYAIPKNSNNKFYNNFLKESSKNNLKIEFLKPI
jgi:hypothetical protein